MRRTRYCLLVSKISNRCSVLEEADQKVRRGSSAKCRVPFAFSLLVEEVEGVCGMVLIERDGRIALICLARLDDLCTDPDAGTTLI
jgi:hypothetical protein